MTNSRWTLSASISSTTRRAGLSGATAKEAAARFDVSLFKEDEHYVYLDLRPRLPNDRQVMERVRVALYGPSAEPPRVPYTPAELFVVKANGDTEHW